MAVCDHPFVAGDVFHWGRALLVCGFILVGTGTNADELRHGPGLEALAGAHPASLEDSTFGVLTGAEAEQYFQRSPAAAQSGLSRLQLAENPKWQNAGWWERREEGDRFWLLGRFPVAVEILESPPSTASSDELPLPLRTVRAGFEPRDPAQAAEYWAEQFSKLNERQRQNLSRGNGTPWLTQAVAMQAAGHPEAAQQLSRAIFQDLDESQARLLMMQTANGLAEAAYYWALRDYGIDQDRQAFAETLETILRRFAGATYWESAMQTLLEKLRQQQPGASKQTGIGDALIAQEKPAAALRLLQRIQRLYWLWEPALQLQQQERTEEPLAGLILQGTESLETLSAMLNDQRLTPLVELTQDGPFPMHLFREADFFGSNDPNDLERRYENLPHPLTVAEVAEKMLEPILGRNSHSASGISRQALDNLIAQSEKTSIEQIVSSQLISNAHSPASWALRNTLIQLPAAVVKPVLLALIADAPVNEDLLNLVGTMTHRRPELAKALAEAVFARELDEEAIVQKSRLNGHEDAEAIRARVKKTLAQLRIHAEPVDRDAFLKAVKHGENEAGTERQQWQKLLATNGAEEMVAWWKEQLLSTEEPEARARLLSLAYPWGDYTAEETTFNELLIRDEAFLEELAKDDRLIPIESWTVRFREAGPMLRFVSRADQGRLRQENFITTGKRWERWLGRQLEETADETLPVYLPDTIEPDPSLGAEFTGTATEDRATFLAELTPKEAAALRQAAEEDPELRTALSPLIDRVETVLPASDMRWKEKLAPLQGSNIDRDLVQELLQLGSRSEEPVILMLVRPGLLEPATLRVLQGSHLPGLPGAALTLWMSSADDHINRQLAFRVESGDVVFQSSEALEDVEQLLATYAGPKAEQSGLIYLRIQFPGTSTP